MITIHLRLSVSNPAPSRQKGPAWPYACVIILDGYRIEKLGTMPGMTYTVVKAGNKEVGGIMAVPKEAQGMPPMWGAYVTVDDVELTAKTAEKLGAKLLVPPTDIPDVGRFCVIQDPQGAVINVITYKEMK